MVSYLLCFITQFTLNYIVLHDIPLTMQYRTVYRYLQVHCCGSNYLPRSLKCTLFNPLLCSVYPIHCTVHGILSLWPKLYSVLSTLRIHTSAFFYDLSFILVNLRLQVYVGLYLAPGLFMIVLQVRFIIGISG